MEDAESRISEAIQRALEAARTHLGLDVAFVSQIRDGRRVFLYVDTDPGLPLIEVGGSDPVEQTYCYNVLNGQIPQFLRDPRLHPVASQLPVTHELPVGTHLSVPIELRDGSVYGTFCCFGVDVDHSLDERDLAAVRMLSRVVAGYIEEHESRRRDEERRRDRLRAIVGGSELEVVFQPIVRLTTREPVGYEALARFPKLQEGPGPLFDEAWRLGIGAELELEALSVAFDAFALLPPSVYLSVNAAPTTLVSREFRALVTSGRIDPARLVVEVTEHAVVEDYDDLRCVAADLAGHGVRLAVDDVGMGSSGLHHIVRVAPDIIKVDLVLVRDVDSSIAKQALISALLTFAARTGVTVVAEGIETRAECDALRVLGVEYGQGFHVGRPGGLPAAGSGREQEPTTGTG